DGLLFDTEMLAYRALNQTLKNDHNVELHIDIYKQTIGMDLKGTEMMLRKEFGNVISFPDIFNNYSHAFKQILEAEGLAIKSGVTELLDYLDERGLKRCIASSSSLRTIKNYLSLTDLTDR